MSKDVYESPLSSRYASPYMLHLFSADMRFQTWRRLWTALARAEHELGLPITAGQVAELEAHITDIDYAVAEQREREVRHDVMSARLRLRQGRARPPQASSTSARRACYVTDNADLIISTATACAICAVKLAVQVVLANSRRLCRPLDTPRACPRLHASISPPSLVTVGKRAALWMQRAFSCDLEELDSRPVARCKLLGSPRHDRHTRPAFMDLFDGDERKDSTR